MVQRPPSQSVGAIARELLLQLQSQRNPTDLFIPRTPVCYVQNR